MPIDNLRDLAPEDAAPSTAIQVAQVEHADRMRRLEVEALFSRKGTMSVVSLRDKNVPVSRDLNANICFGEGGTPSDALKAALDALESGKHKFGSKGLVGTKINRRLTPAGQLSAAEAEADAKDAEIAALKKKLAEIENAEAAKAKPAPKAK